MCPYAFIFKVWDVQLSNEIFMENVDATMILRH